MNISSIVIQTLPKNITHVIEEIKALDICEYHLHDERGYIIVTIEGEDATEEMDKLKIVEKLKYVICANMQMTYSEDELDEKIKILENEDAVPKMLNDDSLRAEDIKYNGDVKGRV